MKRVMRLICTAALVAAAACDDGRPSSPPRAQPGPTATPQPDASAAPHAPTPAAPAPTASPCPDGVSVDPPEDQLRPPGPQVVPPAEQLSRLRALMPVYLGSAVLRVRAAGLAMAPPPNGNPAEAQQLYAEALQLHGQGCRLPEPLEWEANEGLGISHMMLGSYAEALRVFQQVGARWPTIAQTRYNTACAQCRLNQLEPCYQAFVETLAAADAGQRTILRNDRRDAAHYARLSQTDPDLALLRTDARYRTAIAPYQAGAPTPR